MKSSNEGENLILEVITKNPVTDDNPASCDSATLYFCFEKHFSFMP